MDLLKIKEVLENHQVIAFPTETVFGLGVLFDDFEAYNLLNKVKNRPEDKPYTMMLGNADDISKYAFIDGRAEKLIQKFMPGPLTILLRAKDAVPGYVTHNTGIIGLRVPGMNDICEMINYVGKPLLVPSANKSGEKPAIDFEQVKAIFNNEIGYIVEGTSGCQSPSTLVDLTGDEIKILREGPISKAELLSALEE